MSKNSLDSEPEIRESRWDLTSLVPGKSELETKTGNHEVEEAQALDNLEAFTQEAPEMQVVIGQEWMFYQIAISGWRKQRV
ncbi:rCG23533, partial [Rattus norvegicus]